MERSAFTDFSITSRWESAKNDSPEICETSALLKIVLADKVVTRNEDEWSRTVRDEVRLSAYPLALWFASSWWRLRWEALPIKPGTAWRMAHELAAAGHGYLWPRMSFASDGENIQVWAVQSPPESTEPVRYLTAICHSLPAVAFERVIDDFIANVIARLDAVGVGSTALHDLWNEVMAERADPDLSSYRRLEARLGFDPDECPEELHDRFNNLVPTAGASAVAEIASVCASKYPGEELERILALAAFAVSSGVIGQIDLPTQSGGRVRNTHLAVWERGRNLARETRSRLGLNGNPITDEQLFGFAGLPSSRAIALDAPLPARYPIGLAVRDQQAPTKLKILLRKRNLPGRRFELARLLGDFLMAETDDRWLPLSDTKTARQKTQRAFAAEFLCPIDALRDFLDDDFSSDATEDAAEYFGVSQKAVETQLVNNGFLPPEVLSAFGGFFDFPYCVRVNRAGSSDMA